MIETRLRERMESLPARIAAIDEPADRAQRLEGEFKAMAGLPDDQGYEATCALLNAEMALEDDALRRFMLARLAAWANLDDETATVVAGNYRAALESVEARIALRHAEFNQAALMDLEPAEQHRLRHVAPVLFDEQAAPQLGEGSSALFAHHADADIDTPVYSSDGERLGIVSGVEGKYFRVAAPHRPDYWLSVNLIGQSSHDAMVLRVEERNIDEYRLPNPETLDSARGERAEQLYGSRDERAGRESAIHTRGREAESEGANEQSPRRPQNSRPFGGPP